MKRAPSAAPAPIDYDRLAALLAPKVASIVLAQIATALGTAQDPYTTRKGGAVPPEYQGRPKVWRADARTIPGAVRIGRWVTVPRAAYAAWIASRSTAPIAQSLANANDSEPWSAAAALASVGIRGTR